MGVIRLTLADSQCGSDGTESVGVMGLTVWE